MKITKEQRAAIMAEANKKISDKREKEFEKYYKECTIPSEVDKLNDLASKYNDIDKQIDELTRKKNKLSREWKDMVDSDKHLDVYFSNCILYNSLVDAHGDGIEPYPTRAGGAVAGHRVSCHGLYPHTGSRLCDGACGVGR